MAKKQKAVPASVGIASPHYGVRTGCGAIVEQLAAALKDQRVPCGIINHPAVAGYAEPTGIESPKAMLSFEAPFFWRDLRPVGVIHAARSAYDGSYSIPFGDASEILCPSVWVRDAVRGCTARKTSLWRFGIDPVFRPADRKRGERFRVLHFARDNGDFRKGADIAVQAFLRAFQDVPDADLVLRSTAPSSFERQTGRALQECGSLTPDALADYYRSFDMVIYSSRAEAFASVAIDAAACGVPVVHSGKTGMADISDIGLVVGSREVPAVDGSGTWSEPFIDAIAERLQEAYGDYEAVRARALADSKVVRDRYNWEGAVDALLRHL